MRVLSFVLVAALAGWWPMPATAAEPAVPADIVIPNPAGEVVFHHRAHYEDQQLPCTACHHETQAAVLNMPHPEYFADFWIDCTICHQAAKAPLAPQACATCHRSSLSTIADQTSSAKVAIHRSCWRCHEPGTGAQATAHCGFCHNRARVAASATAAGVK